jgi:transcriptional regulator with XRE-family HTH domain
MGKVSILQRRKALGLSQAELARRLGLSRPTWIKIEKGERELSVAEAQKLEEVFSDIQALGGEEYMRISVPQKHIEKFQQVLLYVLDKVGAKPNVGMTVLYKLLYFIDFDYYEKYETQLMGLTYIKNTHGPTPREFVTVIIDMKERGEIVEVASKYFAHEQKKFLPNKVADLSVLSALELGMIDDVLRRYSDKTATQLSAMTHRDTPWAATKDGEDINYEFAFYRPDEFSVRDYGEL